VTEEQEKTRGFKVEDRRRFSPEGEPRPEHADRDETETQSSESKAQTTEARRAERERPKLDPTGAEISFSAFIVGLSTQALVHLGEIPDPSTNLVARDLNAASQVIDILGMLEQKTRGNLTPEEERLLASILYDLRMKYVELTRAGLS